jgi:hypothetical protein
VVYVLIQLFRITKDEYLLRESLDLVLPANKEYLSSQYTSDNLYDGRSGTLLVIFHLYSLTKECFLWDYISQFLHKIIENSYSTENGIFWRNAEEINLRASCGFAHGTSGIEYVFGFLHSYLPTASLEYMLRKIRRYKDSCWIEDMGNWGDFRKDIFSKETLKSYKEAYLSNKPADLYQPQDNIFWANGAAGIAIPGSMGPVKEGCTDKYSGIQEKLENIIFDQGAGNLYDGMTGLGLCFLEMYYISRDESLLGSAMRIYEKCLPVTGYGLQGGLFHGHAGMIYFLLKMTDISNPSENILIPFLHDHPVADPSGKERVPDLSDTKKMLLSKYFPRTVELLETVAPRILLKVLKQSDEGNNKNEMAAFIDFIEKEVLTLTEIPIHEIMKDVFNLEKEKHFFTRSETRTSFQLYFNELTHHDQIIEDLNRPEEWLLQKVLTISDSVKIIRSRWNWIPREDFRLIQNVSQAPGDLEILLRHTPESVIESSLQMVGLILHRFDEPKTVERALMEIKYFCQSQGEGALQEFAQNTGSKDVQNFISRLDFLVIFKVKELLYDNVLAIKE